MRIGRAILSCALVLAAAWPAGAAIDHGATSAGLELRAPDAGLSPWPGGLAGRAFIPNKIGPFTIACEGLGSPITADFLTGRHSMAILAYDNHAFVLRGAPAASGSKYAGEVGDQGKALLWVKGRTAIFMPPGGTEHRCNVGEGPKAAR